MTGPPWPCIHTLLHNVKYAYFMHEKNGGIIYGDIFSGGIAEVFFLGVFFQGYLFQGIKFWGIFPLTGSLCSGPSSSKDDQ